MNALFRPLAPICNRLQVSGELVLDQATALQWNRQASRYPLSFTEAQAYVTELNAHKMHGIDRWRVPTVNELLSLLDDGELRCFPDDPELPVRWFWSCDRHGHHESWYVNMDMGFAGVQDLNCRNRVRAVADV